MAQSRTTRMAICVGGALCFSVALGVAAAQVGESKQERLPPTGQAEPDGNVDSEREEVRERLTRRLGWTRERIRRHEINEEGLVRALERLDAGERPEVIFQDMMDAVQGRLDEAETAREGARERGRSHERRYPALEPEDRERVLGMLKLQAPNLHGRVEAISQSESREQMDRMLQRLAPKLHEIREAQDVDPELASLLIFELKANLDLTIHSRDHKQLQEDKSASESAIAQSQAKFKELVGASLDAHLALKEHEVIRLESRLSELRDEIQRRRKMREEFIERGFQSIGSPGEFRRRRGPHGDR